MRKENLTRNDAYILLLSRELADNVVSRVLDAAVRRPGRPVPAGGSYWVTWTSRGYTVST